MSSQLCLNNPCAVCVCVGDAGEVWVPAEDGQSGESLETSLVHPQEWRDPLLQISCECVGLSASFYGSAVCTENIT